MASGHTPGRGQDNQPGKESASAILLAEPGGSGTESSTNQPLNHSAIECPLSTFPDLSQMGNEEWDQGARKHVFPFTAG